MFFCNACAVHRGWPESMSKSQGRCEMCGQTAVCNDRPSSLLPTPVRVPMVPRHMVYDGDSAHVELDGEAVRRIKWVESGLGVELADGGFRLVPEDDRFTCGAVYVSGHELNLIFGQWVYARQLRYGNEGT